MKNCNPGLMWEPYTINSLNHVKIMYISENICDGSFLEQSLEL